MSFRQDCVTPVLHHRQLTLWSLQKNITYALCQSHKHYWSFLKNCINRPNRRQLWNGILWLYSKHHLVFFSRRKNRQLVLHHLIDLIWGDTDKRTFFFLTRELFTRILWLTKSVRKQNPPMSSMLAVPFLGCQRESFFPFWFWPFLFGRCWFFSPSVCVSNGAWN